MLPQQVRKLQGVVGVQEYRLGVAPYGEAVGYRTAFGHAEESGLYSKDSLGFR